MTGYAGSVRHFVRQKADAAGRRWLEHRAYRHIRGERRLWTDLEEYQRKSLSTGCSYADYWRLNRAIRQQTPAEILECGTGMSTVVIAAAVHANVDDGWPPARITSMEEDERWLARTDAIFPGRLAKYVDFRLRPTTEDYYSIFRGVRYRDVPDRPYDFVFIDGPKYLAPNGDVTFDFDLVAILQRAERPVSAIIDKRISTRFVLETMLKNGKFRYSPILHLGFVRSATRADLRAIDPHTPSRSFAESRRWFGPCLLQFR